MKNARRRAARATVRPAAGFARCELADVGDPGDRWFSVEESRRVAKKATESSPHYRAFRLVLRKDGRLEVMPADPWAAGWQAYGARLAFRKWIPYILASGAGILLATWMFRKGASTSTPASP